MPSDRSKQVGLYGSAFGAGKSLRCHDRAIDGVPGAGKAQLSLPALLERDHDAWICGRGSGPVQAPSPCDFSGRIEESLAGRWLWGVLFWVWLSPG